MSIVVATDMLGRVTVSDKIVRQGLSELMAKHAAKKLNAKDDGWLYLVKPDDFELFVAPAARESAA